MIFTPFASCLLLLLQLIIGIFALPTKQLKVSLILEKEFHSLNSETVLLQGDDLLIITSTPSSSSKDNVQKPSSSFSNTDQYEWFMAHFTPKGSFYMESIEKNLIVANDGSLKLSPRHVHQDNESDSQHDEESQRHVFSIKDGKLIFNGVDNFTLCPVDPLQKDKFSIHLTYSESASVNCDGGIDGFQLKVYNQLGIQAEDFEAPEFLFNSGKAVYF